MPPRSTGPKVSERDTLPTSVKTQMSGRVLHCTLQTLLWNTEIVLICSGNLSVSVGDNYETPCLLLAADEHVSSNVVNLVNLVRRCATNLGPTRKHLAGNGMHVCGAGAVLFFFARQFSTSILSPQSTVLWSEPLLAESHNRNACSADAQRARLMLVVNSCTLKPPGC